MLQSQISAIRLRKDRQMKPGVSQNVKRFTESLNSLNNLHGVLRAKSKFLTLRANHQEDGEENQENIDDLTEAEWEKIASGQLSFTFAGYDFSSLEGLDRSETPVSVSGSPPPPSL